MWQAQLLRYFWGTGTIIVPFQAKTSEEETEDVFQLNSKIHHKDLLYLHLQ